jgi:hypothetical protein
MMSEVHKFSMPIVGSCLVTLVLTNAVSAAAQPTTDSPMDTSSLGSGAQCCMHTLLEKTIFNVDVLTLDIRLGREDQRRIRRLVAGRQYSPALADSVASIALHSRDAFARIEFLRDVSLGQFVDGVREDLGRARDAGIIAKSDYEMIAENIPRWFSFLEKRRIRSGDRILYRIVGDTLRTQFIGVDGELQLDQTDVGAERRLAVLGSYLAPKSSFRRGLIESLFRQRK